VNSSFTGVIIVVTFIFLSKEVVNPREIRGLFFYWSNNDCWRRLPSTYLRASVSISLIKSSVTMT
jgi:hypothetical protein